MRTIKLRARMKNGKWVVGNFINHFSIYFKTEERHSIFLPKPENDNGGYWVEDIDPETVGQFTGLCDIVGNPIYEGDLLECDKLSKVFSEVYWNNSISAFCLAIHTITEGIDYGTTPLGEVMSKFPLRIVGNIFYNTELLEGGEQ